MIRTRTKEMVGGRYRLEQEVGRGPVGTVFEGLEVASGRPVCVKLLESRYTQDARFAVRFRDAYRRIAAVVHKNLAAVIDYGYQDGRYYIVSEWVEGEDLGSRLDRQGPIPYPEVVSIGRQISAGLQAAHEVGVLHRGLKPHNIFLGRDGRVNVTDLGLAVAVGETGLSKTSVLSSGAGYMAPEQARGESPGPESDVYSVGVLLYEMLTGRQPFEGSGSWSLLRRQVEEVPLQPSRVNPKVPFDLGAVVMIALRKERGARYGSAQDLARALEGSGIEAPVGTEKAEERPGASVTVRGNLAIAARGVRRTARVWRRRVRMPSGLLVALLFMLGFAVTFGTLSTIVDAGGVGRAGGDDTPASGTAGLQYAAAKLIGSKPLRIAPPTPVSEIQPVALGGKVEWEGIVDSISSDLWVVAGRQVIVTSGTEVKGAILVGEYVKVEAQAHADGVPVASKIERKGPGQMFKFRAEVESIDGPNWLIGGYQVVVTSETKLKGSIQVGDVVNVDARELAGGTLVAEEIERHH